MSAAGLARSSACGLDTGQEKVLAPEATRFLRRAGYRSVIPYARCCKPIRVAFGNSAR